jgi:hypothetical protein
MRIKRAKVCKRAMAMYQSHFGFHEPYQVLGIFPYFDSLFLSSILDSFHLSLSLSSFSLSFIFSLVLFPCIILSIVDGTLIHASLQNHVDINHLIPKTLLGQAKLG